MSTGINGPNAKYLKLVSSDNHVFYVVREQALVSKTIKEMLLGQGEIKENEPNVVHLTEVPSHVLERVCSYFSYKQRHTGPDCEIPFFDINPAIAVEMLITSDFLAC